MARRIDSVEDAAATLRAGGLVALPTETVYGLAARAADERAVADVFRVKGRPSFDPLIVHVADVRQARTCVAPDAWCVEADALAAASWPGPLTMVLPRAAWVSDTITAGLPTVGVRVPDHGVTRRVIERAGPLAMPSANPFGATSPTTAQDVLDAFPGADIAVCDGGRCERGIESTVARVEPGGVTVLRPGLVTADDIGRSLRGAGVRARVSTAARTDRGASPGSTERHYAPGVPVVLVRCSAGAADDRITQAAAAALGSEADGSGGVGGVGGVRVGVLELGSDPFAAARTLYASMRVLAGRHGAIAVLRTPDQSGGAWEAVWDRVERASACDVRV